MGNWIARLESWSARHSGLIALIASVAAVLALLGYTLRDFISTAASCVSSFWQPLSGFIVFLIGQPWFWGLAGLSMGVFVGNWTSKIRAKPQDLHPKAKRFGIEIT